MSEDYNSEYMSNDTIGDIKISDDVVASIAGLAASEVEGISSMAGNVTSDIVGKLGIKNSSKGVRVEISEGCVTATIYINITYGASIPKISVAVQDKVKSAIESMTGLTCSKVDVHIVGINVD